MVPKCTDFFPFLFLTHKDRDPGVGVAVYYITALSYTHTHTAKSITFLNNFHSKPWVTEDVRSILCSNFAPSRRARGLHARLVFGDVPDVLLQYYYYSTNPREIQSICTQMARDNVQGVRSRLGYPKSRISFHRDVLFQ